MFYAAATFAGLANRERLGDVKILDIACLLPIIDICFAYNSNLRVLRILSASRYFAICGRIDFFL